MRLRTLRSRLAASFAAAVLAAGVMYAVVAGVVLYVHEERDEGPEGAMAVLLKVASAMALTMPVAAAAAAGAGVWLAGRAVAPMREAAVRAGAARAGSEEPLLPVRGVEEWDALAGAVNGLLRDLRRSMDNTRAFSANAAHELRTPLTAVLGEVQVALRRERTAEEYRAVLRGVEDEITRLGALVEALLTLARADSGELRGSGDAFDLAAVAAEATEGARARHRSAGADIVLAAEPAAARGDPLLARRVLDNLIENAVRHGGRRVEVRVARAGAVGVASVSDDGPGLSGAVRARLFDRFNREAGASDGFGLGLAIAHALTAAQGGRLRLDDRSDATRFVLELPSA